MPGREDQGYLVKCVERPPIQESITLLAQAAELQAGFIPWVDRVAHENPTCWHILEHLLHQSGGKGPKQSWTWNLSGTERGCLESVVLHVQLLVLQKGKLPHSKRGQSFLHCNSVNYSWCSDPSIKMFLYGTAQEIDLLLPP